MAAGTASVTRNSMNSRITSAVEQIESNSKHTPIGPDAWMAHCNMFSRLGGTPLAPAEAATLLGGARLAFDRECLPPYRLGPPVHPFRPRGMSGLLPFRLLPGRLR